MLSQQTLWDAADLPVVNTRAAAAAAIARLKPSMLRQVHESVAGRGDRGAADEEIAEALDMSESTVRAHRVELRDGGQVRDSGRRRPSSSGRDCVVWVSTGEPLD